MDSGTERGDERLEAVGETIEEAKQAADRVSDQESLDLRHREPPDPTADHSAGRDVVPDEGADESRSRDGDETQLTPPR